VPDVRSVLRDGAFEALVEVAGKAESFSRSLGEAAYRGDRLTVEVHIRQLRACVVAMIQTYKDYLDGQGMAASEPAHDRREDQPTGGGVG
jgi:hypothetical protein